MYREAYGIPQIPALKPQGFRTDTGHRILGEHHFYLVTSYQLSAISYQLSAISYQLSAIENLPCSFSFIQELITLIRAK